MWKKWQRSDQGLEQATGTVDSCQLEKVRALSSQAVFRQVGTAPGRSGCPDSLAKVPDRETARVGI